MEYRPVCYIPVQCVVALINIQNYRYTPKCLFKLLHYIFMPHNTIKTIEKNDTGFIYFDREDHLNTITVDMVNDIIDALSSMETSCKSIVIGGKKNFSAGADILQFPELNPVEAYEFHRKLNELALYFREYSRPVISFLNGYVFGGGLELSLSTDIRVCSKDALLSQPEIGLGINAGAGGNVILPHVVGRNRALYMILTGTKLNASTAYDFGLVDILADHALEEATRIAGIINSKPENTVKLAKRAVNNTSSADVRSNLDYEAALFGVLFSEKDTKESINNFIKKKGK